MARYIDRKKFAEKIAKCSAFNRQGFELEGNLLQGVVLDLIEAEPTADVVEVKRGEWIDDIQKFTSPAGVTKDYLVGYKCSVCGRTESRKEPYCNCGAKMDSQL